MIQLHNLSRESLIAILPHAFVCSEDRCFCTRVIVTKNDHNPRTGDSASRVRPQLAPYVATLWAGSSSEPLPDSAKLAPDVVKLVRAGKVAVDSVKEPGPPEAKAEVPTTPPPPGASEGGEQALNVSAPDGAGELGEVLVTKPALGELEASAIENEKAGRKTRIKER